MAATEAVTPRAGAPARDARAGAPFASAFAVVWLSCATACLTLGAVVTFVPRYVSGPLGGGGLAVGVAVGAFAVGACVARPVAGVLADRHGRRIVLLGGAVTMAVAALAHLPALGISGLVAARILLGLGEGAVFTAGAAWAVDLAPDGRRGRSIGLFGLTIWLGLALGPLAGEAAYALAGFTGVWLLAAACPAAGACLAARLPAGRREGPPSPGRRELVPRAARRPGVAIALANIGYAALASLVVLLLAERGIAHASLVFTTFGAAVVVTRLLAGNLPDRLGPERCAAAAGVVEAAGLAVIALAPTLPVALAGAALLGLGFSTIYPALALMVVRDVPDDRRGAALGTFTACFDIGVGVGAPLVGALAALSGHAAGFWLGVAGALAAAAVALTARRR